MAYFSHLWIFFSALVSSNALSHWNKRCTDVSISASLKSQVFLPCHFNTSLDNGTVIWRHLNNGDALVQMFANGRIYFDNPREGRVNAFPLFFEKENFSIFIHDLESSDVGTYLCELNSECWRVKITELQHHPPQEADINSWLFFFAGGGLFVILFFVLSRTGLQNRLLSWTSYCTCIYKSDSEEHNEEHDTSSPTTYIQRQACKSPDPNDPTTSTVTYVIQA